MLKFDKMSDAQRLLVVDADFRNYIVSHFPAFKFPFYFESLFSEEIEEDGWLTRRASEYLSDLGILTDGSGGTSFALATLVAFNIGRLYSQYRAQQATGDRVGVVLEDGFDEEYNRLVVQYDLIFQWARDVYGMKIPA